LVLASPTEVIAALGQLLTRGYFWENLWATVQVIGFGFLVAASSAVVVAIAISLSSFVRRGVYPVVVAIDVIPKITLVPLLLVTFGFGKSSRIIVVVLAAFFPVFLATLSALMAADREGRSLLTSLGANRMQHLRLHQLPAGLPAIFAGLKISLTVSFIAGVLSELYVRQDGLGYLITQFRATLQIDLVFAVTIVVGLLGMALFFAMEGIERRVVFWRYSSDMADITPL
jgi:NitT/TauT family transport system permease protein